MLPAFSFSAYLSRGPKHNPERYIWTIKANGIVCFIPAKDWNGEVIWLGEENEQSSN